MIKIFFRKEVYFNLMFQFKVFYWNEVIITKACEEIVKILC
jgi:hypothetical protein